MTARTTQQCLEEALRCEREAIRSGDRAEMLRLLRLAAAWLEVAKHRATRGPAAPPGKASPTD